MELSFEIIKSCTIKWKLMSPNSGRTLESPKFQYGNSEYCLVCQNARGYIDLWFISKCEVTSPSVPSVVNVQVENPASGKILVALSDDNLRASEGSSFWRKGVSEIERAYSDFGRYSQLKFIVTFKAQQWETRTDEKCVQTSLCIDPIPCSESLSEDLGKLLNPDSNYDVDFQCDGQSVKAHRLVITARSPVLAKMLQSQMVEGITGLVKIKDMDLDTLKLFVRYLYTGRLDELPSFEAAIALYEAADKYEIKSLVRRCVQSLVESLTVENACYALDVADRHSDEQFVEEVVVFILEKNVPSTSKHWRAFCSSHPVLAIEVQNRYIKELTGSSEQPRKKHCADVSTEHL